MKVLQTAIDLVIGLPEILHEYREMLNDIAERDGMPARLQRLIDGVAQRDKRIAELESTLEKEREADWKFKEYSGGEISRLNGNVAELESELARYKSDLARVSEELGLPPAIGPAPGEIAKMVTELATLRAKHAPSIPEPESAVKWLACTAEEVRANPGESETLRYGT